MNQHLQHILDLIKSTGPLDPEKEASLLKLVKDVDRELNVTAFKLDSAEKVKRTTGVLLEETIAELEQKRKAVEAQNRELEIEAALERVRAKAMGMRSSDELNGLIGSVFEELTKLDLALTRCIIWVFDKDTQAANWWMANSEDTSDPGSYHVKYHDHPAYQTFVQAWKDRNARFVYDLNGTGKKEWDDILFGETELKQLPERVKNGMKAPERVLLSASFNNFGGINVASLDPLSDAHFYILLRFARVFDLTFTRVLDLKKAEVQAREAQIEAALERVRSRTMAMHDSDDVGETVATLFSEFVQLGIQTNRCGILIFQENLTSEVWTARANPDGRSSLVIGHLDLNMHPLLSSVHEAWKRGEGTYRYHLVGENLERYYHSINQQKGYPTRFDLDALPSQEYHTDFFFSEGAVFAFSNEKIPLDHSEICKRFAGVFGQTYRRYLDLVKAESNAREAQIEAALERVRARTMAMQRSEELSEVAFLLFKQFEELGEHPDQATVGIINEKEHIIEYWVTMYGNQMDRVFRFSIDEPNVTGRIFKGWKDGEKSLVIDLHGSSLQEFSSYRERMGGARRNPEEERRLINVAFFSQGLLNVQSNEERSKESLGLLERFAAVFDQTYTRFRDLQMAEQFARETLKKASADRIRAEIASMRTVNDLNGINPLLWRELGTLGVPFIRCGVFIMDEEHQQVQTMLSTSDGKAIASFQLPYGGTDPLPDLVPSWKRKEPYLLHWDEAAFVESSKILMQRGAIESVERYETDHRPTELHLHFLPFQQGMLYVGNITTLTEGELQIVQNLADAFSIAYARYEDFVRLEAAKEQIENTLTDLKKTQVQLVQAEKMASLGELTAGIAHEIQNPLNFVNNFSEVNIELAEDLVKAIDDKDLDEARELAGDIRGNQEKIREHGKRADGIVKSMLQHSRASTGQKEPTDLAALADEYLKLAYHGMRAKDKSFNVTMETDFTPDLPKVNVVAQDIGRVLLNLYNNAFQAVMERKNGGEAGYEPKVRLEIRGVGSQHAALSSQGAGGQAGRQSAAVHSESGIRNPEWARIVVSDNGNGVPESIRAKIFQPFFTTKPTGQGTGLGLSLSYDIVTKGHSGMLFLEESAGSGSSFIIKLPI